MARKAKSSRKKSLKPKDLQPRAAKSVKGGVTGPCQRKLFSK
jgi:hypothetical protein